MDALGVVVAVADRQVLARLEEEVAAAQAEATAPLTPGAQTIGPSRIFARWSNSG